MPQFAPPLNFGDNTCQCNWDANVGSWQQHETDKERSEKQGNDDSSYSIEYVHMLQKTSHLNCPVTNGMECIIWACSVSVDPSALYQCNMQSFTLQMPHPYNMTSLRISFYLWHMMSLLQRAFCFIQEKVYDPSSSFLHLKSCFQCSGT